MQPTHRLKLANNAAAITAPIQAAPSVAAWRDSLGISASILCAIHCAAMPFVIGFLPLLGLGFFADPAFHKWIVALCLDLALVAFLPGWRRHRSLTPALVGCTGLSLIAAAPSDFKA